MADATALVPNQTGGISVDGIAVPAQPNIAGLSGQALRQTIAIKSADATDNGVVIGTDGLVPTKTAANGTWDYRAGVSGSPRAIGAAQRVIGIAAHGPAGGASFTINGGDVIPVPASTGIAITPLGNLTNPTIVFTGTDSYFVELVQ